MVANLMSSGFKMAFVINKERTLNEMMESPEWHALFCDHVQSFGNSSLVIIYRKEENHLWLGSAFLLELQLYRLLILIILIHSTCNSQIMIIV